MRKADQRDGFSLIEVTIAIGVTAFCLIAIMGLLPVGLNSNRTSIEQTAGTSILTAIASDLRATPSTKPPGAAAVSVQSGIPIPANPVAAQSTKTLYFASDGTFSTTATGKRYRATITFLVNPGLRSATWVSIKISWPPSIDPATGQPAGSVATFVTLDRN